MSCAALVGGGGAGTEIIARYYCCCRCCCVCAVNVVRVRRTWREGVLHVDGLKESNVCAARENRLTVIAAARRARAFE